MARSESVSVKRLGAVDVAVVSAGQLRNWATDFRPDQAWITPDTDVDAEGRAIGGLNWMIVRSKDAIVLIDPATVEPEEAIGSITLVAGLGLDSALQELAIRPGDVTHVVVTHFHPDHVAGLVAHDTSQPRFPRAEHIVPARDWEAFVVNDIDGQRNELMRQLGPVQDAGLLRMIDRDETIASGITVLDTPGETPGHLCVRVDTEVGAVYYLGDLVHFPAEIEHIDWIAVSDRPSQDVIASRQRVFGEADDAALFVYTHSRFPGWGRIERVGPTGWRWRYLDETPAPGGRSAPG
jgi:glyoxylase-like metal-dependent hydrolase (beta-lactamase superfamily II)